MTISRDIWLYAWCLAALALYKWLESFYPSIPVLHAYLEDLLALPIILKSAQLIIRVFWSRYRFYVIGTRDIWIITALIAVYFELILPWSSTAFTADWLDVGCYVVGAFVFQGWMNQSPVNVPAPSPAE